MFGSADGTGVEDFAEALRLHEFNCVLGTEHGADEVGVDEFGDLIVGGFEIWDFVVGNGCVVDENVDSAEFLFDFFKESVYLFGLRYICLHK